MKDTTLSRGDRIRVIRKGEGIYAVPPGFGVVTYVPKVRSTERKPVVWVLMDDKRCEHSALQENVERVHGNKRRERAAVLEVCAI